jgi:hypothetical protein
MKANRWGVLIGSFLLSFLDKRAATPKLEQITVTTARNSSHRSMSTAAGPRDNASPSTLITCEDLMGFA